MKLKLTIAAVALGRHVGVRAGATGRRATQVPKPTKADVQKVVQMIMADKAKDQAYCQLSKINDQMAEAQEKKDQKKMDALANQADALVQKIGPRLRKADGRARPGRREFSRRQGVRRHVRAARQAVRR